MGMTKRLFALVGLLTLAGLGAQSQARAQAVAFQPVVTPFPSGVTLDVTPTTSADRRYVRMGIGVSFTSLIGFDTYSVPAAVSGGGAGMNGAIGGLGGVGMGMGGGLGAGGGGGFRAAGLGETRAAGMDPPVGFGPVAGDPFARAAEAPSNKSEPAAARSLPQEGRAGPGTTASRAKTDRGRGPGSTLARKSKKARSRAARAIERAPDNPAAEAFPEVFSFDP
jgi:hypothetical protein